MLIDLFFCIVSNVAGIVEDKARAVKEYTAQLYLAHGVLRHFPLDEPLIETKPTLH